VFPKIFSRENKNGAPIFSLFLTNGIIQAFLIITYFNSSTYQVFYTISTSMIMIPYLLSSMYYLKISLKKNRKINDYGTDKLSVVVGWIGTIYGIWLIYANGLIGLIVTALFYAPGALVYRKGKNERNEAYFDNAKDKMLLAIIVIMALFSIYVLITGKAKLF